MKDIPPPYFDHEKARQSAGYLQRLAKRRLPDIMQAKLLFLAERLVLQRYGVPISGDIPMASPAGPVLTQTLNQTDVFEDNFDLLSEVDEEALQAIWEQYGGWSQRALVNYTTSDAFPEWRMLDASTQPMQHEMWLQHIGFEPRVAQAMCEEWREQRGIDRWWNQCRTDGDDDCAP